MNGRILSVNVGRSQPVEHRGQLVGTAIRKAPVAERVPVQGVNVQGDEQVDRTVHGGPEQAVYAYAHEDYEWWEGELGQPLGPGTFGENLTTVGLDVTGAQVGERWQIGALLLEVTRPRLPCWKLGQRMGTQRFVKRFGDAGRFGAYLRIVAEGDVAAGDAVTVDRTGATAETIRSVGLASLGKAG